MSQSQAEIYKQKLVKARKENDPFEKANLVNQAERDAVRIEEHIHFEDGSILAVIFNPEPRGMRLVGCALVKQQKEEEIPEDHLVSNKSK